MRFIPDGPPVITAITQTDNPGFEARALCLVDGFPAEIHHVINTKRQEYNRHTIDVFDSVSMNYRQIIDWGFVEAGHVPIHPEDETFGYLTELSRTMWGMADVIVTQSRMRQREIDIEQFADEHMQFMVRLDAYRAMQAEDNFPAVHNGEIVVPVPEGWHEPLPEDFGPANADVAARVLADDEQEAPYMGTEPEDQG